jgi:hypothetical protein
MRASAVLTVTICATALGGSGCHSPKAGIEAGASKVRDVSATIRADAQLILDNAQDVTAELSDNIEYVTWAQDPAAEKVAAIIDAAGRIDHQAERASLAAAQISEDAQGVTNTVPWWQRLLGYSLWTLLGGAIMLVLAWYGLLPIVIRTIAGLASKIPALASALIPPSVRSAAKLDYEAFDAANPNQVAAVAIKRTSPLYDAAYKLAKAKKGKA